MCADMRVDCSFLFTVIIKVSNLVIFLFKIAIDLKLLGGGVLSRFTGSRSHPHRVLCVCVCVSRCLWVCVIEADSLQLRVITVGYIRSCHAVSLVSYPFAEQASQINGFVLKEKKKHILLDSVETNLNIWRVQ